MSGELRPWADFGHLVAGLSAIQARAREAAARSINEILTLRSWLVGVWIVAYEQHGADRAAYGEGLMEALASEFKARGVGGLGARNLKNCRQLALTWPRLGTLLASSDASSAGLSDLIRQTLSAESGGLVPAPPVPDWQDEAWMARLRHELSLSHLLELSRVPDRLARSFYELQPLSQRWSVRELKRQRDSMLFERIGLARDKVAEKLPEVVLQEDEKLLMYYDNAMTRFGSEGH